MLVCLTERLSISFHVGFVVYLFCVVVVCCLYSLIAGLLLCFWFLVFVSFKRGFHAFVIHFFRSFYTMEIKLLCACPQMISERHGVAIFLHRLTFSYP